MATPVAVGVDRPDFAMQRAKQDYQETAIFRQPARPLPAAGAGDDQLTPPEKRPRLNTALAFMASRTSHADENTADLFDMDIDPNEDAVEAKSAGEHIKRAKGRELAWRNIKPKFQPKYRTAMQKEWGTWLKYSAAEVMPSDTKLSDSDNVMDMRYVLTDKLETERGTKTWDELEPEAKARLIIQGPKDKGLYDGTAGSTSSPTLPDDAMHVFLTIAVSKGWVPQHGDIEAAFLNGVGLDRPLYLRAPPMGLPEIPGVMPALAGGTLLRALKSVYGLNKAPADFNLRHAEVMFDHGAVDSALAPRTLFYWFDKAGDIIGLVATHVDDDLFAGTDWWIQNVVPKIRREFHYSKWNFGEAPIMHLGRNITVHIKHKPTDYIEMDQAHYALGLRQIALNPDRKRQTE